MKNIYGKLDRVGALVGGWESRGVVDELERDLALGLLREVYSALKFGDLVMDPVAAGDDSQDDAGDDAIGSRSEILEPDRSLETTDEAALLSESEILPEPEVAPEPVAVPEPEAAPEPVAAPESSPVIPRRVSSDVIRSLYGSEDGQTSEQVRPIETAAAPEPEVEVEAEMELEVEPEPEPVPARKPAHSPAYSPASSPASSPAYSPAAKQPHTPEQESKPILGETMAKGHKTLGETLRTPGKGERDMAAHIAAAQAARRPGLKRSIGLNDRFLMIRDMFGGDADAFDRAVSRLDAFTDLDEAVIWIHDNFDWKADSPGVTLLIGLLERKLAR